MVMNKVWMIKHKATGLYFRNDSNTTHLSRRNGSIYRTKPSLDSTVGHIALYGKMKVEGELAEEFNLKVKFDDAYKTYVIVDNSYYGEAFEVEEYDLIKVEDQGGPK